MLNSESKISVQELVSWIKKAGESERVLEFQYPYVPNFFVKVAYASKHVLQQIREECKETFFNTRSRTQEEKLNDEKMRKAYARQIIQGFRGLTLGGLQKIVPGTGVDQENVSLDTPVEYTEELAEVLIQVSIDFENWVIDIATNVENFSKVALKKKEQLENLA
jgi:hypothetical protein